MTRIQVRDLVGFMRSNAVTMRARKHGERAKLQRTVAQRNPNRPNTSGISEKKFVLMRGSRRTARRDGPADIAALRFYLRAV